MNIDDPETSKNIVNGLLATLMSAVGGLAIWNGKRFIGKLDQKVDQKDFDDHRGYVRDEFKDVQTSLARVTDTLQRQYTSNTERLDKILFELTRKP